MTDSEKPFTSPRCRFADKNFHEFCHECQRPYFRGYIDTQFFPRDPNPREIYKGKLWTRVFLVLMLIGLALGILASVHLIREEKIVNLAGWRLWEKIIVAVSCVIFIFRLVVHVVSPGHRFSHGTGEWRSTNSTGCSC